MKSALVGLVVVAATACASGGQEVLLTADGVPVTVDGSGDQACVEVGEDGDVGSWCGPGVPEAVWVGATPVGDGLVVVGQAPPEVSSIDLVGEDGSTSLTVEQTDQGRFFVGVDVPPRDYGVTAETENGSEYASGEVSMVGGGTIMLTITP